MRVLTGASALHMSLFASPLAVRDRHPSNFDADLPLLLRSGAVGPTANVRRTLSVGETVLGRFFFIHEARARRDGQALQTYEFLHATFGEYLAARALERELADLVEDDLRQSRRNRSAPTDDDFLHALLSFSVISQRRTTLDFLTDLLDRWDEQRRNVVRKLTLGLFQRALEPRERGRFAEYAPAPLSVPRPPRRLLDEPRPTPDRPRRPVHHRRPVPRRRRRRPDRRVAAPHAAVEVTVPGRRVEPVLGTVGVRRGWDGDHRILELFRDRTWPSVDAPGPDLPDDPAPHAARPAEPTRPRTERVVIGPFGQFKPPRLCTARWTRWSDIPGPNPVITVLTALYRAHAVSRCVVKSLLRSVHVPLWFGSYPAP
jgi:hypothetical protein